MISFEHKFLLLKMIIRIKNISVGSFIIWFELEISLEFNSNRYLMQYSQVIIEDIPYACRNEHRVVYANTNYSKDFRRWVIEIQKERTE